MKITINKLRSIIAEEVKLEAKSKTSRGGFLVVATSGSNSGSWIVGAVQATSAEEAKARGGEAYKDRIGGNYVDVLPIPSGSTVESVNAMVNKIEEAEGLQFQLKDILRTARTSPPRR
jgi:hypothetical protein